MPESRGRFAPSTTGRAHPGTLMAALLAWLDARARGGTIALRLEDLDPDRSKPAFVDAMCRDLEWFGLDWDEEYRQSARIEDYASTLDQLAAEGRVYACTCSRSQIRASGLHAPDGSYRYAGTCRDRVVGREDWRNSGLPLRLHLDAEFVSIQDESGPELAGDPVALFGDPLLRRRDGSYAYHFTSVLDDDATRIDRVVRGRDLAPSTILQTGLRRLFGFSVPAYRHHALLLEAKGDKLSKFHGAVDVASLSERYEAAELCGILAEFAGLVPDRTRCRPSDLVAEFEWNRVIAADVALEWSAEDGLRRFRPD